MRVVLTGAAGRIGRELVADLGEAHELRLLDRRPVPGHRSTVADLVRYRPAQGWWRVLGPWPRRWNRVFAGADVVVHLAAESHPRASWSRVLDDNVRGTWNLLEAAARHRVPRVVFASSHWTVEALEHELAPACYDKNGPKIGSDAAPRPLGAYGVSKAVGELAGRTFVDEGRIGTFLAVRIGSFSASEPRSPERARRWLRPADLRSLFRRCVEADCKGFRVLYGVSGGPECPYDLSATCALLSWRPAPL